MDHTRAANITMSTEALETSALADTMYVSPANIDPGACADDEAAGEMEGQSSGQGEGGEQSRTSGECAGQHTTGVRHKTPDQARYRAGQGLTKVKGHPSKSGAPAASAAQSTP